MSDDFDKVLDIVDEPSKKNDATEEEVVKMDINPSVTIDADPFEDPININDGNRGIYFPLNTLAELEAMAIKLGIRIDDNKVYVDPIKNEVKAKLIAFLSCFAKDAVDDKIIDRPQADWGQTVPSGDGSALGARKANVITDDAAIAALRKSLGYTGDYQYPLWKSGIWVTLREASDSEWAQFTTSIIAARAELGWLSNGKCFSAFETFHTQAVWNFIKTFIITTTLSVPIDELDKYIDILDIHQLAWAMATTKWPNGFPIRQPCLSDPNKCNHEVEKIIKLHRISITDRSLLTEEQRIFMSRRTAKHTPDEVKAYQNMFHVKGNNKVVKGNTTIHIKSPDIRKNTDYGTKWISDINTNTTLLFARTLSDRERDEFIAAQVVIQNVSSYFQWIDRIEISVENDGLSETIDLSYDKLPGDIKRRIADDESVLNAIHAAIMEYIKLNIITVIASPNYPCPKCKGEPTIEYKKHPKLTVMDALSLFFTLGYQHTQYRVEKEATRK